MRKAVVLIPVLLWCAALNSTRDKDSLGGQAPNSHVPFDIRQSLDSSAQVLRDLIRPGFNPIPLPILNRTRCVLLINSKGAETAPGLVSCRLSANRWSGPVFISVQSSDRLEASRNREMVVLMLNPKSNLSVLRGAWKLGATTGTTPGPLVATRPNFDEREIKSDTYSYGRTGAEGLEAAKLKGTVAVDKESTLALYGKDSKLSSILAGRKQPPEIAADYVKMVDSFFNMITPLGIIIHHSATLPGTSRVPTSEREVDQFHRSRGFAVACNGRIYHVAYQYFILPNGRIDPGRPENCQGAHAREYNAYLGISLAGDFSSADNPHGRKGLQRPTAAQMHAVEDLSRKIMERYHIPIERVLRHSDVSKTHCPGDRFPFSDFKERLKRR